MNTNVTDANTSPVSSLVVGQLVSSYDYLKPQHIPQLFARYGNQFMPMHTWLKSMGRMIPVAGESLSTWEENRWHRTITVRNQVTQNGNGLSLAVTLDTTDLDSGNRFYPRVGHIVTIPGGGEVQCIITEVDVSTPSAPVVTIKPNRSTDHIGTLAAGSSLAITSVAYGHNSDQPTGTSVGMTKREFYTQIYKESIGISGSELTNEKWFQVTSDGRPVNLWYTPGIARAEYYVGLYQDGSFLVGQPNTNSHVVLPGAEGAGENIPMTQGMLPWIRTLGKTQSIANGAWDVTDLDTGALYLKSQGISNGTILVMAGPNRIAEIENEMKDFLDNNGTDYTTTVNTLWGETKDTPALAAAFDFRVIRKSGFTWVLKSMDHWTDPATFGAPGYNFTDYGICVPFSTVKDAKTGAFMPNIYVGYKELNGYNRAYEVWDQAGAGPGLKVLSVDRKLTHIRSHLMFGFLGANQTILWDPN